MSPEQAAGRLDLLGPASDVYSLGATLYCLLTGRAPLTEHGAILQKVQRGEFPRPRVVKPAVAAALEAICLKAMALGPENRYVSARELGDDIERWLADEPVSAWAEPVSVKTRRWMRRHKPLVSGMGATLLVTLIGLAAGGVWYQNHQAQAARKLAVTEGIVREALKQARQTRDQLHATLRKPGGVQDLLNQPARWEAQIKIARGDWERAKGFASNAERKVNPELTEELETLGHQLAQDQGDYELALRLEKIHLDTAIVSEGRYDLERALSEYSAAFQEAGLPGSVWAGDAPVVPGVQNKATELMRKSAVKDRLVAALDDWALAAYNLKKFDLGMRLLEAARGADPDLWRDRVRDPALWQNRNSEEIAKLADTIQLDEKLLSRFSAQMLLLVSQLLPEEKSWLAPNGPASPPRGLLA